MLFELDWQQKEFEKIADVEHEVREVRRATDGTIWVQTWWAIYCLKGD